MLRSGGEFTPDHVRWLAAQIPELHVLSDVPVPGVPRLELKRDWPGWWAKMELFDPELSRDILYFDLDTVVLGDVGALEVGRTTLLRDWNRPALFGSGLMYIEHGDKERVWRAFTQNPRAAMASCRTRLRWGDQGFLQPHLKDAARWQDLLPGLVQSYKVDVAGRKQTPSSIICFHGKPRPWACNLPWIPKLKKTSPLRAENSENPADSFRGACV